MPTPSPGGDDHHHCFSVVNLSVCDQAVLILKQQRAAAVAIYALLTSRHTLQPLLHSSRKRDEDVDQDAVPFMHIYGRSLHSPLPSAFISHVEDAAAAVAL
jgi:hypothetical protein